MREDFFERLPMKSERLDFLLSCNATEKRSSHFGHKALNLGLAGKAFVETDLPKPHFGHLIFICFTLKHPSKEKFIEDKYKKTADQRVAETSG